MLVWKKRFSHFRRIFIIRDALTQNFSICRIKHIFRLVPYGLQELIIDLSNKEQRVKIIKPIFVNLDRRFPILCCRFKKFLFNFFFNFQMSFFIWIPKQLSYRCDFDFSWTFQNGKISCVFKRFGNHNLFFRPAGVNIVFNTHIFTSFKNWLERLDALFFRKFVEILIISYKWF